MSGILDKSEIAIPCYTCKKATNKSISWIKSNSSFRCSCGSLVKLDAKQFKQQIAKAEAALGSLGE